MSIQATTNSNPAFQPQVATAIPQGPRPSAHVQEGQDKRTEPLPDKAAVQEAANKTAKFVQTFNSNLQFSVDESTGVTVVKVIDQTTQELIRQIPNEEMLAIAQALDRISGLLVKNKA